MQRTEKDEVELVGNAAAKEAAEAKRKLQFILRDGFRYPNTDKIQTQRFRRD